MNKLIDTYYMSVILHECNTRLRSREWKSKRKPLDLKAESLRQRASRNIKMRMVFDNWQFTTKMYLLFE